MIRPNHRLRRALCAGAAALALLTASAAEAFTVTEVGHNGAGAGSAVLSVVLTNGGVQSGHAAVIIIAESGQGIMSAGNIVDSAGQTWTCGTSVVGTGTAIRSVLCYKLGSAALAAGGSITFTYGASNIQQAIQVLDVDFTSADQTAVAGQGSGNASTTASTPLPSPSLTTTQAVELLIGQTALTTGSTVNVADPAGYTPAVSNGFVTGGALRLYVAYRPTSSTGTFADYTPTPSSSAHNYSSGLYSFYGSSGGGGGGATPHLLSLTGAGQ